jgi:putative transposase
MVRRLLFMRTRSIYDHELHADFVSFSCCRRRRLLDHDRANRVVLGVLSSQLTGRKASYAGFVVMPDHIHAILKSGPCGPGVAGV